MAHTNSIVERPRRNTLVSAAIVVTALYVGREILLPFALAVLLSFLLVPVVELLEKLKVGRIPAVLTVVMVAFTGSAILTFVLAHQVYDLAYNLPNYKENILAKAKVFQGDGTGVLDRVTKSVEEMCAKLTAGLGEKPAGPRETSDNQSKDISIMDSSGHERVQPIPDEEKTLKTPMPVEIVERLSVTEIAQGILGPLISPLASAAIVTVFVIFMLLKREDLRNRFIHLIGGERLNLTTQALDDAAGRVSRYLLMQLIINSTYGLVIYIGLAFIGLPNALLWGALTAVLRFVPFVGPWIGASMPIAISLAVFNSWSEPTLVVGLFIINELVTNNIIEPWLYGSSTGISTIGILAAAVFWGWIWGPVGLVMATPLTVCLTVVGRYVPQLAFLNTMLSDQDALPPQARFYQRLLALDPDEATEVAEEYLKTSSLAELYDTVLLPALSLAEQDRHQGALDEAKQQFVHQTTREIVEELGERIKKAATENEKGSESEIIAVEPRGQKASILCLPARDEADEIAGLMLTQLLEQRGVMARVVSTQTLTGEMIEQIIAQSIAIVCVSALPPLAATHARYLCKRLRPKFPQLELIVGIWQTRAISKKTQERLAATGINKLVTTLGEAASELEHLSQTAMVRPRGVPPVSAE